MKKHIFIILFFCVFLPGYSLAENIDRASTPGDFALLMEEINNRDLLLASSAGAFPSFTGPESAQEKSVEAEPMGTQKSKAPDIVEKVVSRATETEPMGSKKSSEDVLERKSGYFHPYFSFTEYYTDNVLNTPDHEKSDFVTILSPGIRVVIPRVKEMEPEKEIETSNTTPGGLSLSRVLTRHPGTYQSYLMYKLDYEFYSRKTSENFLNHTAQAALQYNFRGGLSIDLADQFLKSHNTRGTGLFFKLDKYQSNLFNTILRYEPGDRLELRLDYANYFVDYTDSRNDFRNRTDNTLSGYAIYNLSPKTGIFAQYEIIDISYDKNKITDSKEHHFYGGVRWKVTEKSKGLVKAGYGIKDFDRSSENDHKDFYFEAQAEHRFTPKTSLKLKATRRTDESDVSPLDFKVSQGFKAEYLQWIRSKIGLALNLEYFNDLYHEKVTIGNELKRRKDNILSGAIALRLEMRKWLKFDAAYIRTKRNSNINEFDYTNNTIMLRATATF